MRYDDDWPFPEPLLRLHECVWAVQTCDTGWVPLRRVDYRRARLLAEQLLSKGYRRIWVYPEDELQAALKQRLSAQISAPSDI